MCIISKFLEDLHEHLTGNKFIIGNIIRKHSKKLDELGDVSFPLNVKNWSQSIDKTRLLEKDECTIFDYLSPNQELKFQLESLIKKSKSWSLIIDSCQVRNNSDVHLYLNRSYAVDLCIKNVLKAKNSYGLQHKCFDGKISVTCDNTFKCDASEVTLTELRGIIIQNVLINIVNHLTVNSSEKDCDIRITLNTNQKQKNILICGSVLNEAGVKDTKTTSAELFRKRALDMQLIAQHKYGVRVKPMWIDYFEKLGKASVTIEMLQNKMHKTTKITLNNLQSSNKGPSFIFYNCARLSALFKEFENRVLNKIYPDLPCIDKIDFTLLTQPEEWEMAYVYVLQFPMIVNSCICDVKSGIINLHNLVLFLSNLSSLFSVYYRRVKILINAKNHLLPLLYARIYFLKAIQQVFHTALYLLNIEPVKEM